MFIKENLEVGGRHLFLMSVCWSSFDQTFFWCVNYMLVSHTKVSFGGLLFHIFLS